LLEQHEQQQGYDNPDGGFGKHVIHENSLDARAPVTCSRNSILPALGRSVLESGLKVRESPRARIKSSKPAPEFHAGGMQSMPHAVDVRLYAGITRPREDFSMPFP
jgi:hypothetical protein